VGICNSENYNSPPTGGVQLASTNPPSVYPGDGGAGLANFEQLLLNTIRHTRDWICYEEMLEADGCTGEFLLH